MSTSESRTSREYIIAPKEIFRKGHYAILSPDCVKLFFWISYLAHTLHRLSVCRADRNISFELGMNAARLQLAKDELNVAGLLTYRSADEATTYRMPDTFAAHCVRKGTVTHTAVQSGADHANA